jgi:hypothetical protein
VTTEGIAALDDALAADEDRLFCYRHPTRETRISCGRCERPICTACAMQGPVGFRCKQCGKLANDPLTTMRPTQVVIAGGIALGLSLAIGAVGSQLGLLSLVVGFFGGGIIAESVVRFVGYKRGPVMLATLTAGIVAGVLVGHAIGFAWLLAPALGTVPGEELLVDELLVTTLPLALITLVATLVGAYSRLR